MAGRPKTRAKRMAEALAAQDPFASAMFSDVGDMINRSLAKEPEATMRRLSVHYAPAPPVPTESRATCARDLYAQMLLGAETALARLNAGVAAGLDARELKELAVTSNVLMRAAKLLEDSTPDDEAPPSLEDLERAEAEAARLLELKRNRG